MAKTVAIIAVLFAAFAGARRRARPDYFLNKLSNARRASSTELAPDGVSRSTRSLSVNFGQSLCRSFLE